MVGPNGLRRKLALGTALTGVILFGSFGAAPVYAGDCVGGPADFVCSGLADLNTDTTVTINEVVPVTVTTADGFGIDTTVNGGRALDIVASDGLTIVDSFASDITGDDTAIYGFNDNVGSVSITVTGSVESLNGGGIFGINVGSGLTIAAADVTADGFGVFASNTGGGAVSITTTGPVVAADQDGISAYSIGTDMTISTASVSGGYRGIFADNVSSGALSITATGDVTGTASDGIFALNYGSDLAIAAVGVNGGDNGIVARNFGVGVLSVTTTGTITGAGGNGIEALNEGTDVIVSAVDVHAAGFGVLAKNTIAGSVSITTTGDVTSADESGVSAFTEGTDLTIVTENSSGKNFGILATNFGAGTTLVQANGDVSATDFDGINAATLGTDVEINANNVGGARTGVYTTAGGVGALTVTTTGSVVGGIGYGIRAENQGTDITLRVNEVRGGMVGISARNLGSGDIFIETSGAVEGVAENGIFLQSFTSSAFLEIAGLVSGGNGVAIDTLMVTGDTRLELQPGFGLTGEARANPGGGRDNRLVLGGSAGLAEFDLAILDDGDGVAQGAEQIFGFSPILMKEDFSSFVLSGSNVLAFEQASITGGVAALSDADLVLNGSSPLTILQGGALGAIGVAQVTGDVVNSGTVLLGGNGSIGGLEGADDALLITGDYDGDGALVFDTVLNDGAVDETDWLVIAGNSAGNSTVTVVNAGGSGALTGNGPTDGILLIEVGGVSDADFSLASPAVAGIFAYDLVQADGQNWYLQSEVLDQAYVYQSLPGAVQAIGAASVGKLVERVGAAPETRAVTPRVWARGVGEWLDSSGDLAGALGGSFEQSIGLFQTGVEFELLAGDSGRLVAGLLGHIGASSLDVSDAAGAARGSADIDAFGGGLSATWFGASGFYLDGVIQYTAYDIDLSTASRWSSSQTDGYGIALSGEAGYRLSLGDAFAIVPQAQLVWQTIDFDDFADPEGVGVRLDDGDSLVGRLGIAGEGRWSISDGREAVGFVELDLLHEFQGDNAVTVMAGGTSTALSQDLGGTSVELGLGGRVDLGDGFALFAEIDYRVPFDDGVEGFQASGGLRLSW
ncbi:MAG: autotransporter outer membrane beta-barrel domain-containing protein [Pseudomonadota bacterium]